VFSPQRDSDISGLTYLNAVHPTPNVTFTYDPHFPRLTAMTDVATLGISATVGTQGNSAAMNVPSQDNPLIMSFNVLDPSSAGNPTVNVGGSAYIAFGGTWYYCPCL
jgi:hypothetical protein